VTQQQASDGATDVVDLTVCDREPIHALGRVQPFGVLFAVTLDGTVARVSANVDALLGRAPADVLGGRMEDALSTEAVNAIRSAFQNLHARDDVERVFGLRLLPDGAPQDLAIYRSDRLFVVEAEPADSERLDATGTARAIVSRLRTIEEDDRFRREAVRHVRALTGFDRVMLYRFWPDESGEVVAEHHAPGLEPYMGLRYPASDIPRQARELYRRNWLRLIADVGEAGVEIEPARGPSGEPLDLSMSVIRAVSPIHLEYLTNMGVRASLSISVIVGGRLWGLFACHHMSPRRISLERRTAAELFGHIFSWMLEARERECEARYEENARGVYEQVMATMADGATTAEAVLDKLDDISTLVASDGVGAWIDGSLALRGATPTSEEFASLVRFLAMTPAGEPFATHQLGAVHPPGQDYAVRAAGVLAIPISRMPRDYLVFFRREVARAVTWAGNPDKPATPGPNGIRLTPRKSFEAWREVVRGQSEPWSEADLRIAQRLRVGLLEVILRITDAAARERRANEERQELLIAELNHRVRNILGLIRGLIGQSSSTAETIGGFADTLGARIQALARAHDQITTTGWAPGSLRELVTKELEAYRGGADGRVRLDGPAVLLDARAMPIVALVIHELTTNAAKYGALSVEAGRVTLGWRLDAMGRLEIDWRESGGPAVQAPSRRGFGSTVIERSIPFELRGEAEVRHELTGLAGRFVVPASFVHPGEAEAAEPAPAAQPPERGPRAIGHALVVEDNMMIALDAEDMLRELGAEAVTMAASVKDALAAIDRDRPSLALLDVNLGPETSMPVAERLAELGVPFLFASGYGDGVGRPEALAGVPMLAKPYSNETLGRAVSDLLSRVPPPGRG
jgi:light-regulated signal transduction histidine kinase (bacteriophytochrome)/CheY-like chemotaxis protein